MNRFHVITIMAALTTTPGCATVEAVLTDALLFRHETCDEHCRAIIQADQRIRYYHDEEKE